MISKIQKQVNWLIGDLLLHTCGNTIISVVYDDKRKIAKIYKDGNKVATISEEVSYFNWPLSDGQIIQLHKKLAKGGKE